MPNAHHWNTTLITAWGGPIVVKKDQRVMNVMEYTAHLDC